MIQVINEKRDHEIVQIIHDDVNVIMYTYKNETIVLNGKMKIPCLVGVFSKDTILETIKSWDTDFSKCFIGVEGYVIDKLNEIYHPSKIVLDAVNKFNLDIRKNYYRGKIVELDKNINKYLFEFPNTRTTLAIPFDVMCSLLKNKKVKHAGYIFILRDSFNDKNPIITCMEYPYSIISPIYIIDLGYIDLKAVLIKDEIDSIKFGENIFHDMIIYGNTIHISFINDKKQHCLSINLADAFNLFYNNVDSINAYMHIYYNTTFDCEVLYDKHELYLLIDECAYQIHADKKLDELFKEKVLKIIANR